MITGFLQISLTSRCNRKCWHCPMAEYLNTDDPEYHLDNGILIPWIRANVRPENWLVELTGGEPTLYDGLEELLTWLSENGYTTHVRTNGKIPIKSHRGVTRIVAFHDIDNPPKAVDVVLIVNGIDSVEKVDYCERNGIPYSVIGKDKDNYDNATHGFKFISYVEPTCHQTRCPACQPVPDVKDMSGKLVDVTRMEFTPFTATPCCPGCKAALDAWRFLCRTA